MDAPVSCVWVSIDQILIPPGHRDVRRLDAYVDSMRAVHQLQPIRVVPQGQAYRLIFGRGRLEAATRLGWTHVLAIIGDLDDLHAELAMIDENLVREELTVLERAEHLCRRKAIYAQLYPETQKRGGPGRGRWGKRRNHFAAFADAIAAAMGHTPRTIQQEVEIATHLAEAVKDVIRPLPVANRKVDLMRLAKLPPDAQAAVAQRLQAGASATVSAAMRALGLTGRPPAATPEAAQADHAPATPALPGAEKPKSLDRDALVRLLVAALHDAIAEGEVAGRPATAVLAERLAALPWPELVLLARGLTGAVAEAAAAWRAAVDKETAERAEPEEGETRHGDQREDGGEPGAPRPTGPVHLHLTTPSSPPLQPLTEGSTPVTTSEGSSDRTPRPIRALRPAEEGVRAADSTVRHGRDHGGDHGSSSAPATAARHTAPLPACPQCGSPNVWRVYGASSGRIACLSCQHHFLPTDRAPSAFSPADGVPQDTGASSPPSRAVLERAVIETLRCCHAAKVRWSEQITMVSASSEGGLATSTASPCSPLERGLGERGGTALKTGDGSADEHHGLFWATPVGGRP